MPDVYVRIGAMLSFEDPFPADESQPGRRVRRGHRLAIRFREMLRTELTFVNPEHLRARRMGRRVAPGRETLQLMGARDGRVYAPRGTIGVMRSVAKRAGVTLVWEPEVFSASAGPQALPPELTPRDYQSRIVEFVQKKRQGVVVLPCGGGKTIAGCMALAATGESALVLVHTKDLQEQWASSIRFVLGKEPHLIGSGERLPRRLQPGEVAVGLVQTLSSAPEEHDHVFKSAGFLIVDECHRAPADLFATVINRCSGRYRLGLSATPKRADGLEFILTTLLGPTLFRLTTLELIERGYLRRPLILPLRIPFSPSDDCRKWTIVCPECADSQSKRRRARAVQTISSKADRTAFKRGALKCRRKRRRSVTCSYVFSGEEDVELGPLINSSVVSEAVSNPRRLRAMAELAAWGLEHDRHVLSLVPRVSSVRRLTRLQQKRASQHRGKIQGVSGSTREEDRTLIIDRFRRGHYRSLVATQIADEGLDVPLIDMMVSGSGGKHGGTAQQRVGRACRPEGHPIPVFVDLVDTYPSAQQQWRARCATYRATFGAQAVPVQRPLEWAEALAALERAHYAEDRAEIVAFMMSNL